MNDLVEEIPSPFRIWVVLSANVDSVAAFDVESEPGNAVVVIVAVFANEESDEPITQPLIEL